MVKESPGEVRCDINGEGEARRGLSSLLVSMTAMYESVGEEQTKLAMLWGWRTPLSPAPLAFPRVRGREDVFSRIEGPTAFVLWLSEETLLLLCIKVFPPS